MYLQGRETEVANEKEEKLNVDRAGRRQKMDKINIMALAAYTQI
jgi:hypothetical protein